MFVQAFDTLKILDHRFGTRDTLKKVTCLSISRALFSVVMPFSHESEHYQLTVGSQDHPVNQRNQTGDEMMCRIGNLVERHLC